MLGLLCLIRMVSCSLGESIKLIRKEVKYVTIGERTFETIKFINVQNNTLVTENYVDTNGRLVLLRWYLYK